MKKRNLVVVLVLTILTLGAYGLYWAYVIRADLVARTGNRRDIMSLGWVFAPLALLVLSLALGFIVDDKLFVALLVLPIAISLPAIIVLMFVWVWQFANTLAKVTGGNSGGMLFVLWAVCLFIGITPLWILLVQHDINTFLSNSSGTMPHPGMPAAPPLPPHLQNTGPPPSS